MIILEHALSTNSMIFVQRMQGFLSTKIKQLIQTNNHKILFINNIQLNIKSADG